MHLNDVEISWGITNDTFLKNFLKILRLSWFFVCFGKDTFFPVYNLFKQKSF